jgi:hypothetical protein
VKTLEKLLRRVETPPWHAAYRFAIGYVLIPLFTWWHGDGGTTLRFVPFFLLALLTLRVVPAVARHLLPFSLDAQSEWFRQRLLAKRFDSYQWRKLMWFGLGLGSYLTVSGRAQPTQIVLAASCVCAGGIGAWIWRRHARAGPVVAVPSQQALGSGTRSQ